MVTTRSTRCLWGQLDHGVQLRVPRVLGGVWPVAAMGLTIMGFRFGGTAAGVAIFLVLAVLTRFYFVMRRPSRRTHIM